MFGIIQAPDYDKNELLRFQKVINEADFLPLHFVRMLTQTAKLVRTHREKLVAMPLGRRILGLEQHGPLQALLFHVALWRMNLAHFDGYPLDSWPLTQVGVILWSLSASAHDWLPRDDASSLPVPGINHAVAKGDRECEIPVAGGGSPKPWVEFKSLAAGGNRIRTIGPAEDPQASS
jgi:hypothetical protein